jgi:hypothetical protein
MKKKLQDGGPVFKGSPKSDRKMSRKIQKTLSKINDGIYNEQVDKKRSQNINPLSDPKYRKQLQDKMQAGGVVKSAKRVGPVDPNGAWTKVQERTLAGAKVNKVPLTKDKELDASPLERRQAGDVAKNGKWIQKAIKKPGALRAQLGAKKGEPIPAGKLAAAAKKGGKLGQRARLAMTLKKMKKK